jgi:N-acetylglucosamine kinase-like BadF-type ATPase
LGTGSNACLYDGEKLISEEKSLGYILGDEGGGAYLGKQLVTAYLQNRLSRHISEAFADMYNLNRSTVLNRVYRSQYPNRYLAQFSKFLINHLDDEDCYALVFESFADFIDRYVCTLPQYMKYTINCSGSVGFYYKQVLEKVLWAKRMKIGKVVHTPMEGLVVFHTE